MPLITLGAGPRFDAEAQPTLAGTERRYGAGGEEWLHLIDGVPTMPRPTDLSRSLVALDQDSTIIAVVEMSQSSWLVAGMLPGINRQCSIYLLRILCNNEIEH